MENFEFVSPTHFVFGKGAEEQVGSKLAERGARTVLLHFGGQSAVKSGLIDRVKASLDAQGIKHVELGGVRPNPEITLAREGIALCKEHDVDWVLAVGGGSVIDSAKAIAVGAHYDGDVWDFFETKRLTDDVLPIAVVLTIPAAGSRDGEHHGDGQHVVRQPLRLEEIPHVPVVVRAHGDGLRRVDDRAAAHGQHPVDIVFLAQRDAFASKRDLGVRTHAAQLHVLDALCIQRCLHAVDQAAFHGALAAEVQQHRTRTALGQLASHLLFSALSEHEVGRRHEFEVLHRRSFPPCVHVMLIVRGATYHIVLPAASPRKSILHRASSPAPRPGSS